MLKCLLLVFTLLAVLLASNVSAQKEEEQLSYDDAPSVAENEMDVLIVDSSALFGDAQQVRSKSKALSVQDMTQEIQDLNDKVTFTAEVQVANPTDWLRQCAYWFKFGGFQLEGGMKPMYSSYYLKDADSGLCTITLASAFRNMMWNNTIQSVFEETDLLTAEMDEINAELPPMELPALVSNPQTARDVVELVKFANKHDMQVSVKNSGHSYSGQSSVGESLLINMRRYPIYSKKEVYECGDLAVDSPASNACKLATARSKSAVVRVGGGEGNDDIFRSVGSWNYKLPRNQTYEVFGGASGIVGGGGGWLLGGGLGMGQERSWGVGVDQVLELEMVLPDGRHVKFGPTEWEEKEGMLYPQTTKVEGMCNANVNHHESQWQWEPCGENEPNWEDLWFAVRGGGGGTFGVLLSTYHQLHDFEPYYGIYRDPDASEAGKAQCGDDCDKVGELLQSMWVDFLIDYLWNPSAVGVDADGSNMCGFSNPAFNFVDSEVPYLLVCRGDPQNTFVKAWREYVPTSAYLPAGIDIELLKDVVGSYKMAPGSWGRLFVAMTTDPNMHWAEDKPFLFWLPSSEQDDPQVKEANRKDSVNPVLLESPMGHLAETKNGATYWTYHWAAMLPVSVVTDKAQREFWVDFFNLVKENGPHCLGGNIAISSDGMSPQPKGYRAAALEIMLGAMSNYTEYEEKISEIQKRVLEGLGVNGPTADAFPGFTEVNHQSGWYGGPLKDDWTKACPLEISAEEREERCMSVQETLFGTENLQRLQEIKQNLDPKNLFSVRHGIGNKEITPAIPPESFQALSPSS